MNETKFKNLLGMAQRAGKLLSGEFCSGESKLSGEMFP